MYSPSYYREERTSLIQELIEDVGFGSRTGGTLLTRTDSVLLIISRKMK